MDFAGAYSWINIRYLLQGLKITLEVAILAIIFSLIIGTVLGILRYMKIPVLSRVLGFAIDIVRNIPLLLIIFFSYFALPSFGISLNPFWATVVAMSVFEGCMISEIVRGGITAIPNGQSEAAYSTGLSKNQTMRYILLPQAFKSMAPSIVSQLIALIKDTNLATVIALPELLHNAKVIYGLNNAYIVPMYIAITFMYWVICFALSQFSKYLSRKNEEEEV